jgi:hypothetical protein
MNDTDPNQWVCPEGSVVTRKLKYHAVMVVPDGTPETKGAQSFGGSLENEIQWAKGILPLHKDATEVIVYEMIERPVARVRRALLAEDPPLVEKL